MLRQCMMADDKLLSFLAMEFADDYGQEFFFQDEYDDSLALAMAAVGDNIITFKQVIFISFDNIWFPVHEISTR